MDEYEGDTVAVVLSACLAVAEACAAGAGLTKQQLCDILMRKGAKNAVV